MMVKRSYMTPPGGLPPQTRLQSDRAMFKEAYAVIPRGSMTDIVTSRLPFWEGARFWVLARPMSGFAETFSHYIAELEPGGGSARPDTHPGIETALFTVKGRIRIVIDGAPHEVAEGHFVYVPPGADWSLANAGTATAVFHWFRKAYIRVDGLSPPPPMVVDERALPPDPMPDTGGVWATTRFVDPADLRHDMHLTIVTLQPGGVIPFPETHVMEHGLYVLEGRAIYQLNQDWVEVEAGDYMWLRAFCPQSCYAAGPGPFRYLLYKDVNRHAAMNPFPQA